MAEQIHNQCRQGTPVHVMALFKHNPALLRKRDLILQYPLHAACYNQCLYGWKIVKFLLDEYPEAARQADSLGRLPLHIAAANEGPSHDSRGMPLFGSGSDDWEERHSMSNNGKEMVSMLLRVFPQAAHARDMNGLLPIDWGLRNNSRGMFEIVTELLDANPKCLRVEGGGRTLLADWEVVAQEPMLHKLIELVLRRWPESTIHKSVQDMTTAWSHQQIAALRNKPLLLDDFIERLGSCVILNQNVQGESITKMLEDPEMQTVMRVLSLEFMVRNGLIESPHTGAAVAATLAHLEKVAYEEKEAWVKQSLGQMETEACEKEDALKDCVASETEGVAARGEEGGASGGTSAGGGDASQISAGLGFEAQSGASAPQALHRSPLRAIMRATSRSRSLPFEWPSKESGGGAGEERAGGELLPISPSLTVPRAGVSSKEQQSVKSRRNSVNVLKKVLVVSNNTKDRIRKRTSSFRRTRKGGAPDELAKGSMTPFYLDFLSALTHATQCDFHAPHEPLDLYQRCPFHSACENHSDDAPAMLAELLKREPGGVKQLDSAGRLPLHVAAANTSNIAMQLVECVLKGYKYACMERDREGRFPVHHAASNTGPCAHLIAAILLDEFPECGQWPVVPLDAVTISTASIRQTNNNTARIPELVPGSFAILHVPAGGGMLLLPPAEDGFKATVVIRPEDRCNEVVLCAYDKDDILDDAAKEGSLRIASPLDVAIEITCTRRGQWNVCRAGIHTLCSETAVRNSSRHSGELLTCFLSRHPSLALIRDDQGGRILHRLVEYFCQRQQSYRKNGLLASEGDELKAESLSKMMACLALAPQLAEFTDKSGSTPLHLMSKVSGSHFTEAFHMLMRNRPMSSWQRDKKGSTPLHLAVISNNYEAARVLISRSDTKRARLVADDNSYKPSDLAKNRQMRRIVVTADIGAGKNYAVATQCILSFIYYILFILLILDYSKRKEDLLLAFTILGPLLWVLETCWEDVYASDQSGDEIMVNVFITAIGMRVGWEAFRFVLPHHYLSRFAFLENARGWEQNRLFNMIQIESFLSLFPQAITQACCIMLREDPLASWKQIAMLLLCCLMYAHMSASQDSSGDFRGERGYKRHIAVKSIMRLMEFSQRVCALALLLASSIWFVALLIVGAEFVLGLANWTHLQWKRIQELTCPNLLSSGMNLVGIWEMNPWGDDESATAAFFGPTKSKQRFMGAKKFRSAFAAVMIRVAVNIIMTIVYAKNNGKSYALGNSATTVLEWVVLLSVPIYLLMLICHYILWRALNHMLDGIAADIMDELEKDNSLSQTVGHVQITVMRARDLMDRAHGVPDPYCSVNLGIDQERTEPLSNTLNPVWEEELIVYVQMRHLLDSDDLSLSKRMWIDYGRPTLHHEGWVKKLEKNTSSFGTIYKERYFVLSIESLAYYKTKDSYLQQSQRGLNASWAIRNITVENRTPKGVDMSEEGFHFTISNLEDCGVMECVVECAAERDKWVRLIQEYKEFAGEKKEQSMLHSLVNHAAMLSFKQRQKSTSTEPQSLVVFEVKDADFGSSDNSIGICRVPMDYIMKLSPDDEVWLTLENPRIPQALQQGQILVRMQLVIWDHVKEYWQNASQKRMRMAGVCENIVKRWKSSLLSAPYAAWYDNVQSKKRLVQAAQTILNHWNKLTMSVPFFTWYDRVREAKVLGKVKTVQDVVEERAERRRELSNMTPTQLALERARSLVSENMAAGVDVQEVRHSEDDTSSPIEVYTLPIDNGAIEGELHAASLQLQSLPLSLGHKQLDSTDEDSGLDDPIANGIADDLHALQEFSRRTEDLGRKECYNAGTNTLLTSCKTKKKIWSEEASDEQIELDDDGEDFFEDEDSYSNTSIYSKEIDDELNEASLQLHNLKSSLTGIMIRNFGSRTPPAEFGYHPPFS